MHAIHFHPRHPVLLGLVALTLALLVMAVMATDVGTLDLLVGGGGAAPEPAAVDTATAPTTEPPAWLRDPMASPLDALRAPAP